MRQTNEISDPVWQDIWDRDEIIKQLQRSLTIAEALRDQRGDDVISLLQKLEYAQQLYRTADADNLKLQGQLTEARVQLKEAKAAAYEGYYHTDMDDCFAGQEMRDKWPWIQDGEKPEVKHD